MKRIKLMVQNHQWKQKAANKVTICVPKKRKFAQNMKEKVSFRRLHVVYIKAAGNISWDHN